MFLSKPSFLAQCSSPFLGFLCCVKGRMMYVCGTFSGKVFGGSQCRAEQRVLVGVVYRASSLSTHDSVKSFDLERISLSPLRASE